MIFLLLTLNFAISWFNCYSVGGIWSESKALGGWIRIVAWCAAIQSAIGFSSVIGFVVGFVALKMGYLPMKAAEAAASLWYLAIILPALGTGLVLTIQSWIVAFRERSLMNMGTAAWNTFAQLHNMYGAVSGIGNALSSFGDFLTSDKDDDGGALVLLVIALVAVALAGGAILTTVLIRHYAGRLPLPVREARA
jgi:hypothetical protein